MYDLDHHLHDLQTCGQHLASDRSQHETVEGWGQRLLLVQCAIYHSALSRAESDLMLDADRKFGGHVDGGPCHTPLALTSPVAGLGMTQLPSWITSAVEICLHRVTVPS